MNDIRLHPETGYWQRIAAADFVFPLNNLRGFGISLVAADMDGNSYPGRVNCLLDSKRFLILFFFF